MSIRKRFVLARGYAISRSYVQMNGILSATFYLLLIIILQKGINGWKIHKTDILHPVIECNRIGKMIKVSSIGRK